MSDMVLLIYIEWNKLSFVPLCSVRETGRFVEANAPPGSFILKASVVICAFTFRFVRYTFLFIAEL